MVGVTGRRAGALVAAVVPLLLTTGLGGASQAVAQEHRLPDPMSTTAPGATDAAAVTPADRAAGSVVRVQTWAHVSVVVHHSQLYKVDLEPHADPNLAGTGFFVNPSGVIATAASVLAVDRDRIERWGVNQAFARTFGMPLPPDPYARTRAPDAGTDAHLQKCYDHTQPNSECAVFVTTETRAYPYVSPPVADGLLVSQVAQSGPLAFLSSTAAGDVTTAALATVPSTRWTSIAWAATPDAGPPAATSGDFTGADLGLATETADRLRQLDGSGLPGSVLVDDQGAVLGMLHVADGAIVPVGADDIAANLHDAGIEVRTGPLDTQLATGLDYIASQEYANAEPYLDQTSRATRGQAVAQKYLDVARAKKNTSEDMSSTAAGHTGDPVDTGTSRLPIVLILLGVVALGALGLWWWRRSRTGAHPEHLPAGPTRTEPDGDRSGPVDEDHVTTRVFTTPTGPPPAMARPEPQPSVPQPSMPQPSMPQPSMPQPSMPQPSMPPPSVPPRSVPTAAVAADPAPPVAPVRPTSIDDEAPDPQREQFCTSCGANMAPGDRFCFSCGTPARRHAGR
jgi:hypothetical protein